MGKYFESKPKSNSSVDSMEMGSTEVYSKYQRALNRFKNELRSIQKEYISSHYSFKLGDIVVFRNLFHKTPTFACIDNMCLKGIFTDEKTYKNPRVEVHGFRVDEDGYLVPFRKGTSEPDTCGFSADDVIEVTNIQYKGLR